MDNEQIEQARQQVLEIFDAGVNRVKGFNAVADYLTNNPMPDEYHMISVGKAALCPWFFRVWTGITASI